MPDENLGQDPDLNALSLEELDKLMKHPELLSEVEAEPEPAPEAKPVEAKPETHAESAPTPQEEAPVEEIDLLKAKLDAAESKAQKFERLSGRHSGELGFLRERIAALESGVLQRKTEQEPEYIEEPEEPVSRPAPRKTEPTMEDPPYLRNVAVQQASSEFWNAHPEAQEINGDIVKYVQDAQEATRGLLDIKDAARLHLAVRSLLEEALDTALDTKRQARVKELETRHADQVRGLDEAKKKASSSATGTPVPPPERPKAIEEMSVKELEDQLISMTKRK